jgi:hypothetical protein
MFINLKIFCFFSASLHDSQVAIALMEMSSAGIAYLYRPDGCNL